MTTSPPPNCIRSRRRYGRLAVAPNGEIFINEHPLPTTRDQRNLMLALVEDAGCVVSRHTIAIRTQRCTETLPTSRSLDVAMSRLRRLLGTEGWRIKTVHSTGYLFDSNPSDQPPHVGKND